MSASQQIVCLPCLCILRKIIEQWSHYRRPGFMGLLHLFHQVRTHLLSQEHILSADLVYLFPIGPYLNLRAQAYLACRLLFENMCYGKKISQQYYYSKLEIVMSENMEYFLS